MKQRVIIENVKPQIDGGRHNIKRVVNEPIKLSADIYADSHDVIRASVTWRKAAEGSPVLGELFLNELENDAFEASFSIAEIGTYVYEVQAWIDHLSTWHKGFMKKHADGQDMSVELQIGAKFLEDTAKTYPTKSRKPLTDAAKVLAKKDAKAIELVTSSEFVDLIYVHPFKQNVTHHHSLGLSVQRTKNLFSTWYEFFPRSAGQDGVHGTFQDCIKQLPRVAQMGFDVLYFPPIHPVGELNRKGKNNSVTAEPGEPGSPWAIGSSAGGHKAVAPELGTMADYEELIRVAKADYGIEVALDLALQCAPDHPYITEHPEWFIWRPDGTIAYAENPPKKYQDIVPINFECDDWQNLWNELKSIVTFWIEKGVTVFRVDNPHTKSFNFWEWCIREVQAVYPDIIFLSEAFSRPRIMMGLAKLGYNQGYSYFTWRNTKAELEEFMTQVSQSEWREFYRPNFWPNTPDILPYFLQTSGPNGFHLRYALAATMSSNIGIYGGAYEHYWSEPIPGKEEYWMSEKFEIKAYDWEKRTPMTEIITRLNQIRRENPALQTTYNIQFTATSNDQLISYLKWNDDRSNMLWIIVNLDPKNTQIGTVETPRELLGLTNDVSIHLHDLVTNDHYHWTQDWNYVELNPYKLCFHVFKVYF